MDLITNFTSVFNKNHKYPIYNTTFDTEIISNLEKILVENKKDRYDLIRLRKIVFFIDSKLSELINIPKKSNDIEIIIKNKSSEIKNDNWNLGDFINKNIDFLSLNNITPWDSLIIVIWGWWLLNSIWFISSIYHRWLPLIYVPTTPLSACDVAVWSKTWLNNTLWVNIIWKHKIWTYFDPIAICINKDLFENFYYKNKEIFIINLAESIKHFILQDEEMLSKTINLITKINKQDTNYNKIEKDVLEIIEKTIELKNLATIVDPFEHNYWKILLYWHKHSNFIETITDYKIPHDLSVLIWILIDLEIQRNIFWISFSEIEEFLLKILKFDVCNTYLDILKKSISSNFDLYLSDIKWESVDTLLLKFVKINKLGDYARRNKEWYFKNRDIELFNCEITTVISAFNTILNKI